MKSYKVSICWDCQDSIDGFCLNDQFPDGKKITIDDRETIRLTGFPEWCPLEDVK